MLVARKTPDDLKSFQQYRPDRILVLVPAASVAAARQLWNTFKGSSSGETGVSRGKVSSGDLPALFVLKTILDLKILAADLSHDVSVRIDAARGSDLQIEGPDDKRAQVLDWIKTLANTPPDDTYFAWAREVAVHQFDNAGADLEALTWERDAQGTVQGIETVSSKHVQDVARIYF